ncbi:MAG: MarR family transcriptional regulator [Rhizobiaceae bacterium]|jgi:DNA-binding MarR family transcriptional regulator|nr:MarR family transcriptional regulator [Rhizobiaceae bacterium]
MFFLEELPTHRMIERYVEETGSGNTERIGDALAMLRKASMLVRKLDAYFQKHGLSQLRFLVLIVIDREPDRHSLRQSEILERLDVSKPVLHRTVAAMIAAGHLERVDDPHDARAHQLSIATDARNLLQEILPGYFELITQFMENQT